VCEAHASEISKLGFCSDHQKLAESQDMCEDCSSSSQPDYSRSFRLFPWMKQIGVIQDEGADAGDKAIEKVEEAMRCSCCGVNLDNRFYPPCILIKPSLNVLEYDQKPNLVTERGVGVEIDEDQTRSDIVLDHHEDGQGNEENKGSHTVFTVDQGLDRKDEEAEKSCDCSVCDASVDILCDEICKLDLAVEKGKESIEEESLNTGKTENDDQGCEKSTAQVDCTREITVETPPKHLEFFIHGDDCRLIPVELVDSPATENRAHSRYKEGGEDFILDFDKSADAEAEPVVENWHISGDIVAEFSFQENENVFKENGAESVQLITRGQSSVLSQVEQENLEQNCGDVSFFQIADDLTKDVNIEANTETRDAEQCSDASLGSNYFPP